MIHFIGGGFLPKDVFTVADGFEKEGRGTTKAEAVNARHFAS